MVISVGNPEQCRTLGAV
uniref:Uncharacterized protein n=1 Tax=Anguilla anguilla TaxID=7936 RepID=A0A0E9TSZ8_ANGAN